MDLTEERQEGFGSSKKRWSIEDDLRLMIEMGKMGNRMNKCWGKVCEIFPERPKHTIRNRYRFLMKQMWKQIGDNTTSEYDLIRQLIKKKRSKLQQQPEKKQSFSIPSDYAENQVLFNQKERQKQEVNERSVSQIIGWHIKQIESLVQYGKQIQNQILALKSQYSIHQNPQKN